MENKYECPVCKNISLTEPPYRNQIGSDQNSDSTYSVGEKKTYNGHEYFLITSDTPMLYDEAVAVCNMFGGYPVVITSAEENAFVETISNSAWIGGRVRFHGISNPTVEWITEEDCTFTYWAFGSYNANDFPQWEGFPLTTAGVWGWNWRDPQTYTETRVICECEGTGNSISALTFGEDSIELNNKSDSDIDGDGILDYQELSDLDLGVFDSTTGVYTPASLSEYYAKAESEGINLNLNVVKKTGKLKASAYNSDVSDPDKDKDTYLDSNDASPLEEMEQIIYVLYDQSNFEYAAKFWENKYFLVENIEIVPCEGVIAFKSTWNLMGLNKDGKQEYSIDKVYLLFHGNIGGFATGSMYYDWIFVPPYCNKEIDYDFFRINELTSKSMNQLILNICESGTIDYSDLGDDPSSKDTGAVYNLAVGFVYFFPGIDEVVGWDGEYYSAYNLYSFTEYASRVPEPGKDDKDYYGWIYTKSSGMDICMSHTYESTQTFLYLFF